MGRARHPRDFGPARPSTPAQESARGPPKVRRVRGIQRGTLLTLAQHGRAQQDQEGAALSPTPASSKTPSITRAPRGCETGRWRFGKFQLSACHDSVLVEATTSRKPLESMF